MNKSRFRAFSDRGVVAAAVAFASSLISLQADAASVGGWAGKVSVPPAYTCLREYSTGRTNLPNSVRNVGGCGISSWDVPLMLTSGGSHTVTAKIESFSPTICDLYGVGQDGRIQSSQRVWDAQWDVTLTVNVSGPAASLLFTCALDYGGAIVSVDYNM